MNALRPHAAFGRQGFSPIRGGPCFFHTCARVVLIVLLLPGFLFAQQPRPLDYEVKATYLFNFGRFTTWPQAAAPAESNLFSICVLGRDPFGPALDATLAGETIAGRRVVARRIARSADAAGCRILFVGDSEEGQLQATLDAVGGASILTVSDLPRFAARGGMIQFVSEGNRIRFEVNLTAAERSNLMLSSELLKVATAVRRSGRPGA